MLTSTFAELEVRSQNVLSGLCIQLLKIMHIYAVIILGSIIGTNSLPMAHENITYLWAKIALKNSGWHNFFYSDRVHDQNCLRITHK